MSSLIMMFIPEESYILLLVLSGLLLIIGFRKIALGMFAGIVLIAFLSPFLEALIDVLPDWLLALLLLGFALSLIRLIIGRRVFENVFSFFLYDMLRMPFRALRWVLGRTFKGRGL